MKKIYYLLFLMITINPLLNAQKIEKYDQSQLDSISVRQDSLKLIDYLAYDYKYLDKEYNIHIDSCTFNEALKRFKFYPERIKRYKDSIVVIMCMEFNDYMQTNIAAFRLNYTWLRLSFHTWQQEEEAKQFASYFGITHPWRMKLYLIDESNHHPKIEKFFRELKRKVHVEDKTQELENISREHLLDLALRQNPVRIAHFQNMKEQRKK